MSITTSVVQRGSDRRVTRYGEMDCVDADRLRTGLFQAKRTDATNEEWTRAAIAQRNLDPAKGYEWTVLVAVPKSPQAYNWQRPTMDELITRVNDYLDSRRRIGRHCYARS